MKKKYIVKSKRDFEKIIKKGKCIKDRNFVIHYIYSQLPYDRYGISVSKKLGNAVFRNKYKRKLRNIIDNYKKNYINGKDYIIILRKSGTELSHADLEKDFFKLMNRIQK